MSLSIPTLEDPYYTIRVRLDERDYTLEFYYATRSERWYLSLFDTEDNPLVCGLKLVTNVALLRSHHHKPEIPPGELIVTCSTLDKSPPKLQELGLLDEGKRCTLTYFPRSELLEASGGA
jgi:hypothetical protein